MTKRYLQDMLGSAMLIAAVTLTLPAFAADETAAPAPATTSASASPSETDMQILRDKIYADKKFVVANNLNLTDDEAKKFWPIYEDFQKDLHKINDRTAKVINDYALAYNKGALLDDTAKKLIKDALDVEMDEVKLKQSYVPKLSKALPGVKVARYMQIENKIRAIIRYELASAIPLAH